MAATSALPALAELKARAKSIRKGIITSTTTAGSGHPTSSLSGVEIAVALFFGGILRYDPKNPHWPERDRFILSKGHAAPLLYAVLAEAGYFPKDQLATLRLVTEQSAAEQAAFQAAERTLQLADNRYRARSE